MLNLFNHLQHLIEYQGRQGSIYSICQGPQWRKRKSKGKESYCWSWAGQEHKYVWCKLVAYTPVPNIKPPATVPTVQIDPYSGVGVKRGGGAARGMARGGAAAAMGMGGGGGAKCKALYDFEAENPDELSFSVGAIIDIVEKQGEVWKKFPLKW